ncbi:MAG: MFS transporter [Candidatus Woesearchaeota archaeon]
MGFDNITKLKYIYFFKSLNFFAPILALFYLARGLNTFQLLSLEVILTITLFFAEVPTGIIADKLKRKYSVSIVVALYIIGNILTIYSQNYYMFALIQVIFGLALAFGSGAIEALVYDSLKSENRQNQMNKEWGSINSMYLFAGVISALIGGYLTQSQTMESFVFVFWLYTIGSIIALIISFFIVEPKHHKTLEHESVIKIFKDAVSTIRNNKSLRYIIYVSVLTVPFPHIIKLLFQPYFNLAGVSPIFFGVGVSTAMLIGAMLVKYAYRIEEKLGVKKTIFLMNIIPSFLYIGMSFIVKPIIAFAFYVLIFGIANMRNPIFSQYQNDHIESKNRATVLSVISMFHAIYFIISQLIIGMIANYDLLTGFLSMGIIILITSIIFRIDEKHLIKTNNK